MVGKKNVHWHQTPTVGESKADLQYLRIGYRSLAFILSYSEEGGMGDVFILYVMGYVKNVCFSDSKVLRMFLYFLCLII